MDFATDLDVFAEEQERTQRQIEDGLVGSAKAALRRWGQDGWYDALLARAEGILRARFRTETKQRTSAILREEVDAFHAAMTTMLEKTKEPTSREALNASARSIAASLSTAAVNAALEAAAVDDDTPNEQLEKVWLSMEDESVRPTHAAAHGQVVGVGEKFTVGGSKMVRPGDTSAPIGEWINCRCLIAVRERQEAAVTAAVTAAADMSHDGALIVMLPEAGSPVHDLSSEDDAHITTVWFGTAADAPDLDVEQLAQHLAGIAPTMQPATANVTERTTLGADDADVLMLDTEPLVPLRDLLLENEDVAAAHDAVEQFPDWTPHVTLGYPDTPAAEGSAPNYIRFDRLALWVGDDHSRIYPMGADMADDTTTTDSAAPEPLAEGDRLPAVDGPIPFWGCLAPEDTMSGDGRMFDAGALRARPLPLPLAFQRSNEPGHDSSVKIGNYERMWRANGMTWGMGHLSTVVPEVDEVIGLMAEAGGRMGLSIDADDGVMEMRMKDGRSLDEAMAEGEDGEMGEVAFEDVITAFSSARICGATAVHIPAFHQAFIELGEVPEEFAPKDGEDLVIESIAEQEQAAAALAAAGGVKTEDGPGWITHPVDTDRLRDYWSKPGQEGYIKIGWGTPGDFNRCRAELAAYVKPQYLSGYCANRHYDALGFWPGRPLAGQVITAGAWVATAPKGQHMAPSVNLVAAAPLVSTDNPLFAPPREWFEDPHLTGPAHLTITDEGRVFGHIATWGTCHIGIQNVCTTPPQSMSDYSYFATGVRRTDDGDVNVGQITYGTGHADLRMNAAAAAEHYDNTGTAVMDVAAGEDEWGIWVAGALRPGLSTEQVIELRAADVSGDWREIRNNLEMVGLLSVNVAGFPVPRTGLAASGGHQTALVAAGIVRQPSSPVDRATVADIVRAVLEEERARVTMKTLADQRAARQMAEIKAKREAAHAV